MNLVKLFEVQKELMDRIEKEHPTQPGEKRFNKKVLALLVEISECANEWRGFKYWKVNPEPTEKLLEECVDVLHFILELGIDLGKVYGDKFEYKIKGVEHAFLELQYLICCIYQDKNDEDCEYDNSRCYESILFVYEKLTQMLGFAWEQIEQAYFEKNKINHERQDNKY